MPKIHHNNIINNNYCMYIIYTLVKYLLTHTHGLIKLWFCSVKQNKKTCFNLERKSNKNGFLTENETDIHRHLWVN